MSCLATAEAAGRPAFICSRQQQQLLGARHGLDVSWGQTLARSSGWRRARQRQGLIHAVAAPVGLPGPLYIDRRGSSGSDNVERSTRQLQGSFLQFPLREEAELRRTPPLVRCAHLPKRLACFLPGCCKLEPASWCVMCFVRFGWQFRGRGWACQFVLRCCTSCLPLKRAAFAWLLLSFCCSASSKPHAHRSALPERTASVWSVPFLFCRWASSWPHCHSSASSPLICTTSVAGCYKSHARCRAAPQTPPPQHCPVFAVSACCAHAGPACNGLPPSRLRLLLGRLPQSSLLTL